MKEYQVKYSKDQKTRIRKKPEILENVRLTIIYMIMTDFYFLHLFPFSYGKKVACHYCRK